jgi:hypothetical protein
VCRFYKIRVELVVAKFRAGVQAVAVGTGSFVNATDQPERQPWFPLKMGVRFLASTLHASLRIVLFFLIMLIGKFARVETHAMDLVGALPVVLMLSTLIRIALVSSGIALWLWPSALLLVADYFAFGFSSWWFVLKFSGEEKVREPKVDTWLAWCVIVVSYYNFVLVMFCALFKYFTG